MARTLDVHGENQGKVWEGLPGTNGAPALKAYMDSTGHPTIGWGHVVGVKMGDTCSTEQAQAWFDSDLQPTCACVEQAVKAPLGDNQFAALVWFTFNVGRTAFETSTLVKLLNMSPPNYDAVPAEMARWNKGKVNGVEQVIRGLVNRRALETALWLAPDDAVKPSEMIVANPKATILTRTDLRQVEATTSTPVAPPTKPSQTRGGQANITGTFTGIGATIIGGATQAQNINSAMAGAFSAKITSSQIWMLASGVLAFITILASIYAWYRKKQEINHS